MQQHTAGLTLVKAQAALLWMMWHALVQSLNCDTVPTPQITTVATVKMPQCNVSMGAMGKSNSNMYSVTLLSTFFHTCIIILCVLIV